MSLLSVKEVANLVGISEPSVIKQIQMGRLKALRIGRLYRFRETDVANFIKETSIEPSSQLCSKGGKK